MLLIKYIIKSTKLQDGFPRGTGFPKRKYKTRAARCLNDRKKRVFHSFSKNKNHEKAEFYTVSTEFSTVLCEKTAPKGQKVEKIKNPPFFQRRKRGAWGRGGFWESPPYNSFKTLYTIFDGKPQRLLLLIPKEKTAVGLGFLISFGCAAFLFFRKQNGCAHFFLRESFCGGSGGAFCKSAPT